MYLCCLFVKCESMSSVCKNPVSQTESVDGFYRLDGTVREESATGTSGCNVHTAVLQCLWVEYYAENQHSGDLFLRQYNAVTLFCLC